MYVLVDVYVLLYCIALLSCVVLIIGLNINTELNKSFHLC